ncbi:MAG: glycosyltransferase family 9 protein [Acidobacteria bacterium]|nr:glycosyltransferase family 9 protein [Acidobacteriota bacterium]
MGLDSLVLPERTLGRLGEFTEIYSWYGSARAEFRAQVSGLPFRFFAALPGDGCGVHACDFYLGQVGASLGGLPRIEVRAEVGSYAVIQPFSGSLRKNWGLEKFRAVASGLGMEVRCCCGPEEELAGALRFESLRELMPFLAGARVYLGNDSGISHLAAALGAPVVAVFGPTDAKIWAPRGNVRVMRFEDSVEEVIAAARSLLR